MQVGTVVDGRFRIERLAGTGGMASVYRAIDNVTGRPVALKVLVDPLDDPDRFAGEARILAALDHPNVVRYITHGETPDARAYLALEWLDGEDLADRLRRQPPAFPDSIRLVRVVARALAAAHARAIVHRDVKPGNVFLVDGRFEQAKVLDFGIARALDSTRARTKSGVTLGTPSYMAPEQARGARDVDAPADVFSLGCVLFECLTGRPPFVGNHVMATLAKVLFEDAPRVSELWPEVPDDLDDLVDRMLRKDPKERPKDAAEVAVALEQIQVFHVSAVPRTAPLIESAREISSLEQRVLAVLVADAPVPGSIDEHDPTVPVPNLAGTEDQVRTVASFGARLSPLADGSLVAVFASASSATDLAVRAARCALALARGRRGGVFGIAMGRGMSHARMPVGEVIDRAVGMVRRTHKLEDESVILIDDLVAGLLDDRFEVRGAEHALRLRGEQAEESGSRNLLGKPTPCVGRARELGVLESTLSECVEERVARGVLVTGSAGMGKSRVRHELLRRIRQNESPTEVWMGRGDPIAAGAPFGVIGSALKRIAGLTDDEPLEARRRKLSARVSRCVAPSHVRRVAEFLGEILGVAFPHGESVQLDAAREDPSLMGDQIRRAFDDLIEAETNAAPLLMVLEDLHWGDAPSIRLVDSALRHCREQPLMVLAVGRPEVTTLFPSFGPAGGFTQLALGELSKKAQEQLISLVLGDDVSRPLRDELLSRAGGNAFFLEELMRHVARGDGTLLPETVLAMLDSRLTALSLEERRTLRAASVFGTVFWAGGVATLAGGSARTSEIRDSLALLRDGELVQRRPSSRFAGEEELVFRHSLLRDAAYASLTEADRQTGHALAVAWLVSVGERDPIVLAEHYARAGDRARAAGGLVSAAEQALEGHDAQGALQLLGRARAMAGDAPDRLGIIALLEAESHRWRGETMDAERRGIEAYTLLAAGSRSWFRAITEAINASGRRGDYDLAIQLGEQLTSVQAESDAGPARAMALCAAGRALFHAGGYELADQLIERVRGEYGEHSDPRVRAEIHRLLGARARHVGDLASDLAEYERALEAYELAGDERNACNARVSVAFAWIELGEHARARAYLERALEAAERMGLSTVATRARQNLGLVLWREGRLEEARDVERAVAEESREQRNIRFEGWTRIYLARILHSLGDLDGAIEAARHAAQLLEVTPPARAGALAALALAFIAKGEVDAGTPHANEATSTLEAFGGIEEFEPLVWQSSIRAALGRADREEAKRVARRALDMLRTRAQNISDLALRQSFLVRVPENATLSELARELGLSPPTGSEIVVSPRVALAYDANRFREDAGLMVERIARHLEESSKGVGPVGPEPHTPDSMLERFSAPFPEEPGPGSSALVDALIEGSRRQHHPRYLGYQVSAPIPRAALFSMLAAILNSGMAAFESGPAASVAERRVIDWMLSLVGWQSGGGGVLTSGGSLANLTALLAARQARAGFDAREDGLAGRSRLVILCAEEAHYSIERAAQIMGLGRRHVLRIPTDERFRLDPNAIGPAVQKARARGEIPFALVASAGSTGTGAIDPLAAVADACAEQELWMHVDGAHGASALLSERLRAALSGIERADSLVWDAHKLMNMPALASAVLMKNARDGYEAFAQRAAYLFHGEEEAERWFDIGLRTVECTKTLIGVPLYATLATFGTRLFGDLVEHGHALARALAERIQRSPDFELLVEPESNIVCFRHCTDGDIDAHQREIRARLCDERRFFVVLTTVRGRVWLRVCLMSPVTEESDLDALLGAIRTLGG